MSLKHGSNTLATNGQYFKQGTNNPTYVKHGSTTVWTKQTSTTYTVTLSAVGGSWNKSSITGITSGTSISFNTSTLTLTVGSQTAKFTPTYVDEVEHYNYSSITNASGSITANRTVTATAIEAYQEWTGQVDIDGFRISSDSTYIGTYSKAKIVYDVLAFGFASGDIDYTSADDYPEGLSFILNSGGTENPSITYFSDLGYGQLDMTVNGDSDTIYFGTMRAFQGSNGIHVFECWKILYL